MVSLRTVLLWMLVVAFGVIALATFVISLVVIMGDGMNAHIWLPAFLASLTGLIVAAIAAERSSARDQEELPPYESWLFSWFKPTFLAIASAFFASLAVLVAFNIPESIESVTCTNFGAGDGPTFERCTTERDYWALIPSIVVFLATFLPAIGGAAIIWRDYLSNRIHLARGH